MRAKNSFRGRFLRGSFEFFGTMCAPTHAHTHCSSVIINYFFFEKVVMVEQLMVLMLPMLNIKPSHIFLLHQTDNRSLFDSLGKKKKKKKSFSLMVKQNLAISIKKHFDSQPYVPLNANLPVSSQIFFSPSLSHFGCDSCEASAKPRNTFGK